MADPLFEVRNTFYLGAFQQCIDKAQNLRLKADEEKLAKDVFMYRAYIALNKSSIALSEIDARSAPPALKAVRRFADYSANAQKRKAIVEDLDRELKAGTADDDVVYLMAAFIYMNEQNYDDALRILHQSGALEAQAATIQCLLKIDRVDLAVKEMKKMQETDEDATVTQLALAWVNMTVGKEKLQDAFYIYQEMIDKYGATPMLLVGQSSCMIQQQKYEDAEKLLQDAIQRDSNNAEALINMAVVSQFLGKATEVTNRYITQLKEGFPTHSWTMDYLAKEKLFDRIAMESAS